MSGTGAIVGQGECPASGSDGMRAGISFATTHWTVVLSAREDQSLEARAALEELCRTYWRPLYAYIRLRGHGVHDAQDLVQEFFYRLLDKHYLSLVDPRKGRFRTFLLVAVNHFLANEWDKARTLKRGGHVEFIPFDASGFDGERPLEPVGDATPETAFEQRWAIALLERALTRLKQDSHASGRATQFDNLKTFLTGETPPESYAVLAARLETTEGALKMAVQRLRQRFGQLVREEVARTVSSEQEVAEEIRHLFAALSGA